MICNVIISCNQLICAIVMVNITLKYAWLMCILDCQSLVNICLVYHLWISQGILKRSCVKYCYFL